MNANMLAQDSRQVPFRDRVWDVFRTNLRVGSETSLHNRWGGGETVGMKFVLFTTDPDLTEAAREGIAPPDTLEVFDDWKAALESCLSASMLFVDLVATLDEPHRIGGYERFAEAKMGHAVARDVPLVLIAPPEEYTLDFMTGYPDFVFAHLRRPVTSKIFRRASTWV